MKCDAPAEALLYLKGWHISSTAAPDVGLFSVESNAQESLSFSGTLNLTTARELM